MIRGFKISWDVDQILTALRQCAGQAANARNDGLHHYAWHCKQDLLQVKYELDRMLRNLPKFVPEDAWIREQEKRQVWQHLISKDQK